MARPLARLQDDLGFTLFEAVDGVRRPTAMGQQTLRLAIRMAGAATEIAGLEQRADHTPTTLRIATTDSIAVEVLGPAVPDLLAHQPGLTIEFLASTENVNFSRWEADLAVRLSKPDKSIERHAKRSGPDLSNTVCAQLTEPFDSSFMQSRSR